MKRSNQPFVVRSYPYWEKPPEEGQDLEDLEWGVMEVMSDKSLRFVKTDPDPEALKELIEQLKNKI
ncbi:hypothetical protein D9M68_867120 [compost metagenome]